MPHQPDTVVTDWGQDEFTRRLLENFPPDWSSDESRQPKGVLNSLFVALAIPLEYNLKQILFTFNAMRIGTATDTALDAVGRDFFGDTLKRTVGENDTLYRERILVHLLSEKATIRGISRAIELFTGHVPVIREPWNMKTFPVRYLDVPDQYGAFWDHARMFSPELRYQFFIDAELPGFKSIGAPIYGMDKGAAFDVPQTAWWAPQAEWQRSRKELYKLIVATKPVGTTAWVHVGVAAPL